MNCLSNSSKVGFIGAGNMAGAMIRGLRKQGLAKDCVAAFDVDREKLQALDGDCGITIADTVEALITMSETVILAVKPQMLATALAEVKSLFEEQKPLIISIAAGTSIETLQGLCGEKVPIIRVMPNLNATVGEAMSAFCGNALVTDKEKETATAILSSFGKVTQLPENQFAAYSALAGCSPAYTMLYMDALASVGEKYGIDRQTSLQVVAQAVLGTAKLLAESGEETETWITRVCSPGGTTIEGIKSLRNNDVKSQIQQAAEASIARDLELQKK